MPLIKNILHGFGENEIKIKVIGKTFNITSC